MKSNTLVWFGPLSDTKIFEYISFRYDFIRVIGEAFFDTSELSPRTCEKISIDYSLIEIGNNFGYYASTIIEGVSYVPSATFMGKSVSFDKLSDLGASKIKDVLDGLDLDGDSELHIVIANQLIPKLIFETLVSTINEYPSVYFYILIDNRIDHLARLSSEEIVDNLSDNFMELARACNLNSFSLLEFIRAKNSPHSKKYTEMLYILNGLNQEISFRKNLEEKVMEEKIRIQECLKESGAQIGVLTKEIRRLDAEKKHFKDFANDVAAENLKLLIEISKK